MRSAERRKVNGLEIKCLRSLVGVSRMDRVRNEEVRRRAGIEMELASRAYHRVLNPKKCRYEGVIAPTALYGT